MNLCSNDTMGTRNILRSTNHRHSKYPEKFNNVKEGKKSGPEIAYGQTHSYGSLAFELSRFHCISSVRQNAALCGNELNMVRKGVIPAYCSVLLIDL